MAECVAIKFTTSIAATFPNHSMLVTRIIHREIPPEQKRTTQFWLFEGVLVKKHCSLKTFQYMCIQSVRQNWCFNYLKTFIRLVIQISKQYSTTQPGVVPKLVATFRSPTASFIRLVVTWCFGHVLNITWPQVWWSSPLASKTSQLI